MIYSDRSRFSTRPALSLAMAALLFALIAAVHAAEPDATRAKILLVGIDHLGKKHDVHNSPDIDPLEPRRQAEIAAVIDGIARFKPTKVMIERNFGDPKIIAEYQQYLQGKFQLGGNEVYQYGFRLATLAHNPTIYPIDTIQDFPFDYPGMLASAEKHGQKQILDAAETELAPYLKHIDDLVLHGTIGDVLRYLNDPKSLAMNAGWYPYAARVGDGNDYAGADLVSIWYARNVHIYANMMRDTSPGDRVVVFIGAGHAPSLRWMIEQSPDLELMDTEKYLR
ncbi:MAG: hypothetical protein KGJ56_06980 [Gammaproteobacteria bacterium]|nr:hypothetical protein [Gammaproteobacteria bacterium]